MVVWAIPEFYGGMVSCYLLAALSCAFDTCDRDEADLKLEGVQSVLAKLGMTKFVPRTPPVPPPTYYLGIWRNLRKLVRRRWELAPPAYRWGTPVDELQPRRTRIAEAVVTTMTDCIENLSVESSSDDDDSLSDVELSSQGAPNLAHAASVASTTTTAKPEQPAAPQDKNSKQPSLVSIIAAQEALRRKEAEERGERPTAPHRDRYYRPRRDYLKVAIEGGHTHRDRLLRRAAMIGGTYCILTVYGMGIHGRVFGEGLKIKRYLLFEAYIPDRCMKHTLEVRHMRTAAVWMKQLRNRLNGIPY